MYRFAPILFCTALAVSPALSQEAAHSHQDNEVTAESPLQIPNALKAGHDKLHRTLSAAASEDGPMGEAARKLVEVMHPHFVREEEIALPPLGLLKAIAEGNVTEDMRPVVAMTDTLAAEMPEMLEEHKAIVAELESFRAIALQENFPEYVAFADMLKLHAQEEEQILYPAALLVGRHVERELRD